MLTWFFKEGILENEMLVGIFTVRVSRIILVYQMILFIQKHLLVH